MRAELSPSARENIASAYLSTQDLTGKSPEEITRIYFDVLTKIDEEIRRIANDKAEKSIK